mmetsp:Transcript_25377/g.28228  ORF Transcript_25377/g.28228 Transcript_25377/m.28228 type:complete len:303 (-) Transcript_25377:31-939(-)
MAEPQFAGASNPTAEPVQYPSTIEVTIRDINKHFYDPGKNFYSPEFIASHPPPDQLVLSMRPHDTLGDVMQNVKASELFKTCIAYFFEFHGTEVSFYLCLARPYLVQHSAWAERISMEKTQLAVPFSMTVGEAWTCDNNVEFNLSSLLDTPLRDDPDFVIRWPEQRPGGPPPRAQPGLIFTEGIQVQFTGILQKQSDWLKKWNPRYFELKTNLSNGSLDVYLEYYIQKGGEMKGKISLSKNSAVGNLQGDGTEIELLRVSYQDKQRGFVFKAQNAAEAETWKGYLRAAIGVFRTWLTDLSVR